MDQESNPTPEMNDNVPQHENPAEPLDSDMVAGSAEAGFAGAADEAFSEGDFAGETAPPPTESQIVAEMRAAVAEADRKVLEAQADSENFRKRMRREQEQTLRYATTNLLVDILNVRDNLHRALDAAADAAEVEGLREGVAMVAKQLDDALEKHHCKRIAALGETFDPNLHEAVAQIPSEDYDAGIVAQEATVGFQLHDRVIRPSQVLVSTGKPT
ncbi:MAG: nucleotide exchange factor GrpE [Planctomycetota bacterium]